MKQTITIEDLNLIVGKFIIEINTEEPNLKLTADKVDLEFYFAKRINFIAYGGDGIIRIDLYGNSSTTTCEKFVEWFNDYVGNSKGERFHRLLYNKELDLIFNFIKTRNY